MNSETSENRNKTLIAFGCIAASLIGLVLGILMPTPVANTFSPGALFSFAAFLGSLAAVKDRGSNIPAGLAFTLSFLAMSISIFCSSLHS